MADDPRLTANSNKYRERALSIAPMITDLADEVLALRCKYQNGEQVDHAVGEVRNVLENLEDAMEKNREVSDV